MEGNSFQDRKRERERERARERKRERARAAYLTVGDGFEDMKMTSRLRSEHILQERERGGVWEKPSSRARVRERAIARERGK